jgi:hypothetical protein
MAMMAMGWFELGCSSSAAAPDEQGPALAADGSGSISGPVGGITLEPASVLAIREDNADAGMGCLQLKMSDHAATCADRLAGRDHPGESYLVVHVYHPIEGGVGGPTTGTFEVDESMDPSVTAGVVRLDASCSGESGVGGRVESGTITLDSVETRMSGTFEFAFDSGDNVTGTFDAPLCGSPGQAYECVSP